MPSRMRAAISAVTPKFRWPSSMTMARLVFLTEAMMVSSSRGTIVRGSITSASMPSPARMAAAFGDLDHGTGGDEGDVAAGAEDIGDPEGDQILLLGNRRLLRYISLSSKMTTGLLSRIAVFIRPLAS